MIGKRKDIGKITGLICEVTLMKDFSWKIFAIKTIIFSIWGLSTLPFLSIIVWTLMRISADVHRTEI